MNNVHSHIDPAWVSLHNSPVLVGRVGCFFANMHHAGHSYLSLQYVVLGKGIDSYTLHPLAEMICFHDLGFEYEADN